MVANRETSEPELLPRGRLKRSEYDVLVGHGAFEGERLELLFGELIEMSSQEPPHRIVTQMLSELLMPALRGRAKVQTHAPIVGADESEPEPDVSVYAPEDDKGRRNHPTHVHLVIEVAQTSRACVTSASNAGSTR